MADTLTVVSVADTLTADSVAAEAAVAADSVAWAVDAVYLVGAHHSVTWHHEFVAYSLVADAVAADSVAVVVFRLQLLTAVTALQQHLDADATKIASWRITQEANLV